MRARATLRERLDELTAAFVRDVVAVLRRASIDDLRGSAPPASARRPTVRQRRPREDAPEPIEAPTPEDAFIINPGDVLAAIEAAEYAASPSAPELPVEPPVPAARPAPNLRLAAPADTDVVRSGPAGLVVRRRR